MYALHDTARRNARTGLRPLVALLGLFLALRPSPLGADPSATLPSGFIDVRDAIPGLEVELRYFTPHNFVGEPIDGYEAERCILTSGAAEALKGVQDDLKTMGFALKVYDAYRPQRAVDHFVRWAKHIHDTRMKSEFYPDVDKSRLFGEGYIASRSGHSRGSTVDLTLISIPERGERPEDLDMGSPFDFFGPESWPSYADLTPPQKAHRKLLRSVMMLHGFTPYAQEWWHFTLAHEPFPDTYFDFPIR